MSEAVRPKVFFLLRDYYFYYHHVRSGRWTEVEKAVEVVAAEDVEVGERKRRTGSLLPSLAVL